METVSEEPLCIRDKAQKPTLVGRTIKKDPDHEAAHCLNEDQSDSEAEGAHIDSANAIFKSAQWTADGTTILASREDNTIESYILPPNLLSEPKQHSLEPYSTQSFPSPVYAVAGHPGFELSEPSTTLYIASPASLPIRLLSPFSPNILSSFPLINSNTEAYVSPHSLLFGRGGRNTDYFFAGSDCQISFFNLHRNGEGPFEKMQTIPSRRKKIVGGGVGMKGIVSALSMSCEGFLAAGTFTRWVGLYDGDGRGGVVGVFELGKNPNDPPGVGDGAGITQLQWSDCGRYLCTVERASDGVGVWDIRGTGKRLAWLRGRNAKTMQRLGIDLKSRVLLAGGSDGFVRFWNNVGVTEGVLDPDWEFQAHDEAVASTIIHPYGNVFTTCSGQWRTVPRKFPSSVQYNDTSHSDEDVAADDLVDDRSLRVWKF